MWVQKNVSVGLKTSMSYKVENLEFTQIESSLKIE